MKITTRPDTGWGPSAVVDLSGDEVALAIMAYLVAHEVHVCGAQTITVNGELIREGKVHVDPSGYLTLGSVDPLRFPSESSP